MTKMTKKKNSKEYTKKKKKDKVPLPIFIMICAVLLFATYTSISTLILAIWGESVLGTVDRYSTRIESTKAEANRYRTVFKGYWFLVDDKEYRGYVAYASGAAAKPGPIWKKGKPALSPSATWRSSPTLTSLPL